MIERASTVLPDPDSPDDAQGLAAVHGEGDPVDGPDGAPAGAERGVQVLDHQQRFVGLADVGELERRLAPPGPGHARSQQALADVEPLAQPVADQVDRQQEQEHGQHRPDHDVGVGLTGSRWTAPSAIMFPHDGVGRGTDSPRKASEPSITMTPATVISPKVTATGTTLGRISRKTIRLEVAPRVRAATTKSRLAKDEARGPDHPVEQGDGGHPDDDGDLEERLPPEGDDGDDRHDGREGQEHERAGVEGDVQPPALVPRDQPEGPAHAACR